MTDLIRDLLARAEVPAERETEAREHLASYLADIPIAGTNVRKSRARSLFEAAGQRGTQTAHNKPLEAVEQAARALEESLLALRLRGYSHSDFWMSKRFGPVRGELESPGVFRMLQAIQAAAVSARIERKGHPRATGDLGLVKWALVFYAKFSCRRPTATIFKTDRGFLSFAALFHEAVMGEERGPETLQRQAKLALQEFRNETAVKNE